MVRITRFSVDDREDPDFLNHPSLNNNYWDDDDFDPDFDLFDNPDDSGIVYRNPPDDKHQDNNPDKPADDESDSS